MKNKFTPTADYSAIGRCKQKDSELYEKYSACMREVFRQRSGIPFTEEPRGPDRQHLKMALHNGPCPEIKGYVEKEMIGFATASVAEYENYATHEERHDKQKKALKKKIDTFHHEDCTDQEVYYAERGRGRVRGQGRRNRQNNLCHYCHKPGHWAKDCREKKADEERRQ